MSGTWRLGAAALWAVAVWAQPRAPLSNREALELFGRSVELMEATSVATPELARAAAPLVENARQALITLRTMSSPHGALTYTLLGNLRAYVTLADAVPKTQALPQESERQFSELRVSLVRIDAHFQALLEQKEAQLRDPDRDRLRRYAEANVKLPPPQPGRPRVVFLGDSITDGWRLNEYFPERDFVNRGISGQITGEMLGRMKADVIDLRPALVLVLAGTNDIARGVSPEAIKNNLTMIADLAAALGLLVLRVALFVIIADRQHGFPYADYFSATVDQDGMLKAELSDDGLHPNSTGYRVMAPLALGAIDKALAELQPKPRKKRLGIF